MSSVYSNKISLCSKRIYHKHNDKHVEQYTVHIFFTYGPKIKLNNSKFKYMYICLNATTEMRLLVRNPKPYLQ